MAKRRAKSLTKAKSKLTPKSKTKAKSDRLSRALASGRAIRKDPAWLIVDDPLNSLIDASAHALDLPFDPAWKGAIRTNLEVNLRFAAAFADFPLPDDAEPAPVFTA
jgi:hypothetical protein